MRILIVFILLFIRIFAGDLEKKIQMLQTVPKEQRYILINQIKRELANLNQTQRAMMIQRIRNSTPHNPNNHTVENQKSLHIPKKAQHTIQSTVQNHQKLESSYRYNNHKHMQKQNKHSEKKGKNHQKR